VGSGPGNLVLIGMPGVGKSTVGVLLAKATGRDFVDTDVLVQAREGASLPELIAKHGPAGFLALEERHVCSLRAERTVIATGGSVVYGERAMAHLRRLGTLVHLELPPGALEARAGSLAARGVVSRPGQDLAALYQERAPLYRRWAEYTVDADASHEEVVRRIAALV
jgi:shikimate kinase